ncbi:unnamed protein product [Scytosiphon promiscuus]
MLWREFNYFSGYSIPNFDKMVGNPVVRYVHDLQQGWRPIRVCFDIV